MFNNLYKKCLDLAAHKSSKYYLAFISFIEDLFKPSILLVNTLKLKFDGSTRANLSVD